jgi:hypothetical protein
LTVTIMGAQFEISIDGMPRTYRDLKALAIERAERLKRKQLAQQRRGEGSAKRQGHSG